MVPVKTFQVKPPASFGADQIPLGSAVEFDIQGAAGRFLSVDGNELYRTLVQLRGSSSELSRGGDNQGKWFYALPETGTYRVLYAPTLAPEIKFSWLAADDPITDPGMKPEQFSIEFGNLGKGHHLVVAPYAFFDDMGVLSSWPTHLALETKEFEFRIIPTAGYKKMFPKDQDLALLERAITDGGKSARVETLPYALREESCGYITSFRHESLEGEGWRGLRWIGGFGGDESYPSCGLGYVFAGISNDGRYLIILRADISHPDQKRLLPPRHINGTPPNTWESSDPKVETEMRLRLEKNLAGAPPSSFSPNLDDLDAVIRSLKIKR